MTSNVGCRVLFVYVGELKKKKKKKKKRSMTKETDDY